MATFAAAGPSNGAQPVVIDSGFAEWVVAHNNIKNASTDTTNIATAGNYTGANPRVIKLSPNARRLTFRVQYDVATTTVTTNPRVRIFGVNITPGTSTAVSNAIASLESSSPVVPSTGVTFFRLDSATNATAGVGFALLPITDLKTGTAYLSDTPANLYNIDTQGAQYIVALVETAAVTDGSSADGTTVLVMKALT